MEFNTLLIKLVSFGKLFINCPPEFPSGKDKTKAAGPHLAVTMGVYDDRMPVHGDGDDGEGRHEGSNTGEGLHQSGGISED